MVRLAAVARQPVERALEQEGGDAPCAAGSLGASQRTSRCELRSYGMVGDE